MFATAHDFSNETPIVFGLNPPILPWQDTQKNVLPSGQLAPLPWRFRLRRVDAPGRCLAVPAIFVPSTKSGNEILNSCSNKVELETFDHHMIVMEPKNKSRIRGGSPSKMPES